jgi:hypothetical protein
VRPLLGELRVLDVDATVNPLYGHQQSAGASCNPPSVADRHTFTQLSNGRAAVGAGGRGGERQGACRTGPVGAARPAGARLCPLAARRQRLGNEGVMSEAERMARIVASAAFSMPDQHAKVAQMPVQPRQSAAQLPDLG